MRLLVLLFGLLVPLLAGSLPAKAQTPVALMCWQGPANPQWAPCSASTPLQTAGGGGAGGGGGGSGSVATTFVPNGSFATLTATGSSASVALPTGFAVLFQNVGTTTVSCTVGIGSATATSNELIIPANSPFLVLPGSNTFGACIDQTGTASNLVVLAGGALQDHTDLTAPIPSQSPAVPIGGVAVCDGANGATNPCTIAATVKAVSTAPVTATDKALVVDLRPDSPGIITLGAAADTASVPVVAAPSGNATAGVAPVVCGSAVSSCVLKASAGNLYAVYADCTAACWLMVFNATSAPANGATTAGIAASNMTECVPIAAGGVGGVAYSVFPAIYTTGMTATISSTACATLTLSTVGFIHGLVK